MKILIADNLSEFVIDELTKAGHECTIDPSLSAETLPGVVSDHEVIVVRSTKVQPAVMESAKGLKLVVRAGAGTNTIDKTCAKEKGVKVCNVPGVNSIAVAELAMGLIISIDREIPHNVLDLRQGGWDKKRYSQARGIYGSSLGILGLGSIGFELAKRASAFGMNVFGVAKPGRSVNSLERIEKAGIALLSSRKELLHTCDVVSIHLPATPETKHLVDKQFLSQMKEEAILINTSRGELVDEPALIQAMNEKGIRAGLDVYANEPDAGFGEFRSELAMHSNVYGTHHIGASTQQAQDAVAKGVVEVINSFANGELINCVNQ